MKVLTLNCGNDAPGQATAARIVSDMITDKCDLMLLHCQEADFEKTLAQLRESLGLLLVTPIQKMVTHTKLSTQFHNRTGLMTLVIYNPELTIEFNDEDLKQIRRDNSRLSKGYNKGGMYSRFTVTKKENDEFVKYSIAGTNAHLDAFSEVTRLQDWSNIHGIQRIAADNYADLATKLPHMIASGIDMNTRNKIINKEFYNPWQVTPLLPSMQSLVMAPLGNKRMSSESTYQSNISGILKTNDKNRKDCVRGGTLDIVSYNNKEAALRQLRKIKGLWDNEILKLELIDSAGVTDIPPDNNSGRDHSVIGSDKIIGDPKKADFDKIREFISCSLVFAAPKLAEYILSNEFDQNADNETCLYTLYKTYLAPEGLMQKQIAMQAQKLEYVESLTGDANRTAVFIERFFPNKPWFECVETPKSHEELQFIIKKHQSLMELEKLRFDFFKMAQTIEEQNVVLHLIHNATNKLNETTDIKELEKEFKQAEKLLQFNQLLKDYSNHLNLKYVDPLDKSASTSIADSPVDSAELLVTKKTIISQLQAILILTQKPTEIHSRLIETINDNMQNLGKDRYNGSIINFLRKLKLFLTGLESPSHGKLFVAKAKDVLEKNVQDNIAESDPGNGQGTPK